MRSLWVLIILLCLPSLGEACQLYRDVTMDRRGNVISNVSITVTIHGTGTNATLYSDDTCAKVIANPATSSSDGIFSFYVQDGNYDFALSRTNYKFTNPTNIRIAEPAWQNRKLNSLYKTQDICAQTIGAIDQIGANRTTLVITTPATCSASKTVPATLDIEISGAGSITCSGSPTLTINGTLSGPPRTLFTGCTVVLADGTNPVQYGQWTGTSVGTKFGATTFATLGTPSNGTVTYCSDCTFANTCAGSGTGAIAKRLNGAWRCD